MSVPTGKTNQQIITLTPKKNFSNWSDLESFFFLSLQTSGNPVSFTATSWQRFKSFPCRCRCCCRCCCRWCCRCRCRCRCRCHCRCRCRRWRFSSRSNRDKMRLGFFFFLETIFVVFPDFSIINKMKGLWKRWLDYGLESSSSEILP